MKNTTNNTILPSSAVLIKDAKQLIFKRSLITLFIVFMYFIALSILSEFNYPFSFFILFIITSLAFYDLVLFFTDTQLKKKLPRDIYKHVSVRNFRKHIIKHFYQSPSTRQSNYNHETTPYPTHHHEDSTDRSFTYTEHPVHSDIMLDPNYRWLEGNIYHSPSSDIDHENISLPG